MTLQSKTAQSDVPHPDESRAEAFSMSAALPQADPLTASDHLSEDELLDTVMQASEIQQIGRLEEAIALYKKLVTADPDGHYGAMARKALEGIEKEASEAFTMQDAQVVMPAQDHGTVKRQEHVPDASLTMLSASGSALESQAESKTLALSSPSRKKSIRQKLFSGLLIAEAVTLLGVLGGGALVTLEVSQAQKTLHAQSETISANWATQAVVRGIAKASGLMLLLIIFRLFLGLKLTQAITHPLTQLQALTEELSQGKLQSSIEIQSNDEFEQLAQTLHVMANHLSQSLTEQSTQVEQTRYEAKHQQQKAEHLQQRVMELLLEIDGAREGDLTVRAQVNDDEMGSVADAFNSTIGSLQNLVLQAQQIATHVSETAAGSEESVGKLAHSATMQAEAMSEALQSVEEVSQSINVVSATASEAAQISRQASEAANHGGEAMEQTVNSINELRGNVAETSKKVKRLTESSQEISRIVALISEVSAKTNLLAFNASVEAVRAGEHGQGFRVVADEVRRLAEQVTYATQEIEQLVTGIQLETAEVLTMMEKGTEQVVTGSQLVGQTRTTLSSLVQTNQEIDELLQTISSRTDSQTQVATAMSETMQAVAAIAKQSSTESADVAQTLQLLVGVSQALQHSVAQFRA